MKGSLKKFASLGWLLGGLIWASSAVSAESAPLTTPTPTPPAPQRIVSLQAGPLATAAWDSLNLARATHLWVQGDLRDAAALLDLIDISESSAFARADRAAFLLAVTHLRLGDNEAFRRVAQTGNAADSSLYRQWLAYAALVVAGEVGQDAPQKEFWYLPGTTILTAAHLLETGRPEAAAELLKNNKPAAEFETHHRYLLAVAQSDPEALANWRELSALGAAALPASQVHAVLALAAGDTATALQAMAEVIAEPIAEPLWGPTARSVSQIAGQLAADEARWPAALEHFEKAHASWTAESAWLADLADPAQAAQAWHLWAGEIARPGEIPLPALDWSAVLDDQANAATNLKRDIEVRRVEIPAQAAAESQTATASLAHAQTHVPDAVQWQALDRMAAARDQAAAQLDHFVWTLSDLERERDRRLSYLADGRIQAVGRNSELEQNLRELDLLLVQLNSALTQLDLTRDEALRLFAERVAVMAAELRTSVAYLQAVRHFHAEGPPVPGAKKWPASVPRPAELLDLEEALSGEILGFLKLFNERVPELVNRSSREVWVPRLAADGPALRLALAGAHAHSSDLIADFDSTALALPIEARIAAAEARAVAQSVTVDSLVRAEAQLKDGIVTQIIARGGAQLNAEREGLDYLRGNALYWVAASAAPDLADEPAQARARELRQAAREALQNHLVDFPNGRARAENRYRLADLALLQARDDFQVRMAGFLNENPSAEDLQNRDLAPFVNYEPAVALYREILSDDPEFAHTPAVIFQLGMILGDAGDPASGEYLTALVQRYPNSLFNQEAWLRLGDQHFEARDYAACQPHFEAAAQGADPSLRAIALYKLGWAHFERDQFAAAANAFGELLDQQDTPEATEALAANPRTNTDLADEAQEYLVHSLIRAGGATAFTEHFARVGERPYEADILIAMGHQLSGVSLYGEAIACDELWLEKFGDRVAALGVAQRIVDGYRRWHKPTQARTVHLALAESFLPGTAWHAAQTDVSKQAEAEEFARQAYERAAVWHHQQAREQDDPAAWRLALQHYDAYLGHWPNDEKSAGLHNQAGEAAHHLGQHAVALAHFQVAATGDTTRVAREAAWQVVAVSDAWYRAEQGNSTAAVGPDSLARRLIDAVQWYDAERPDEARLPELKWRQGQLAYAHQWYDEAAVALSSLADRYPADKNAVAAVRMSGDARYQLAQYRAAGEAYQQTRHLAQQAGSDSLVVAMGRIIPRCYYQEAEQVAAADSVRGPVAAAPLFANVAAQWPDFQYADLALYRSGLGFAAAEDVAQATAAWEELLTVYPTSAYARDSALQIATAHEAAGNWQATATALTRFSEKFSADPDAASALLKAGDLLATAGDVAGAEAAKTAFVTRFPQETETVMAISEERALKALDNMGDDKSPDDLAGLPEYLALAKAHPQWAAPEILARVDYRRAELAHQHYTALKLTQPLPAAVKAKQASLENLLALYAACTEHGVAEYTRASAFRIGEAITHFGDALLDSERPAELQGEDLLAYEEILDEQSWPFYDRGEAAWTDLLKQTVDAEEDPGQWLARTGEQLWPRMAQRFMHMPEAEYPLVAAAPPVPQSEARNEP